ncbi:MAG: hypothetical protein ABIS69_01010 [Sediminibacterium sp.]
MRNGKNLFGCLMLMLCVHTAFTQTNKNSKKGDTQKVQPVMKQVNSANAFAAIVVDNSNLHLGRYELYSGIPSMYLGHFILLNNGKYKLAFNTDEENYDDTGTYTFHNDTNTLEWISGMFKNNSWGGKFEKTEKGFHIQFNKATYGDSK